MSRRTRRLPRAHHRSRTTGARVALVCALAVAVSLTGLAVVAPATASAHHGRHHHHPHQHRAAAHHPAKHHAGKHHTGRHHTGKHHHGKKKASKKPKHTQVWSPMDGTFFNYPFSPHHDDRYRIRQQLRNAVKAAPAGSRIRFTTFSFVDDRMASSLVAADRRGVSVQVLVNRKDVRLSRPFRRLQKALGHSRRGHPRTSVERASFVRTCAFSCRGSRGNLHSKIYLFSKVGHTRWVSMVGSANLTTFASVGQWNHLNTITGKATYLRLRHVFNQMRRDRALRHPFLRFSTPKTVAWVFPRLHTTFRTDPAMRILNRIRCRATPHTGVKVKHGHHKHRHHKHGHHKQHSQITRRTVIRIAMYAWFDGRGNSLARAVRHKWNQGCDVRVIYSVLNGTVKRILYDPSGRGRIPMRRSVVRDGMGNLVDYNHSKYIAVNGGFAGKGRRLVWSGSMNFTHLGLSSDDIIVRFHGRKVYRAYLGNFRRVWHAPTAQVPLPTRG